MVSYNLFLTTKIFQFNLTTMTTIRSFYIRSWMGEERPEALSPREVAESGRGVAGCRRPLDLSCRTLEG